MRAKRSSKNNVRANRGRLIKALFLLCFVAYASYTLVVQTIQINANNQKIKAIDARIQQANVQTAQLTQQKSQVGTPQYIQDVARKRDGLVMPNEIVFVDSLSGQ